MNVLELSNVCKSYISDKSIIDVVDNISFSLEKGEIIAIVGPSGGGKTTILNLIAGLIKPNSGIIKTDGSIGYMFQRDNLFEWLTIISNVLLGVSIEHKITKQDIDKGMEYLDKYDLSDFAYSYPSELSGGMRQRIALIRTMMLNPNILLLDEPFSALDAQSRIKVSSDVGNIIRNVGLSAILVTHDINEAISLADRVIVLTKRPCKIKKEYIIEIDTFDPIKRRESKEFSSYFKLIWDDLNE